MSVAILFGTESGNSEMLADDIAAALSLPAPRDLADVQPDQLDPNTLYLIVCSTYGDGELPASAQPFADALQGSGPDLVGVRYALFGLGDSNYADSYSRGSEQLDQLLSAAGATRVGEYGRHDAAGFDDAGDLAVSWARAVTEPVLVG